jgi:hypothetical protein
MKKPVKNKITNKRAKDPVDQLIFEKGLRIKEVYSNKPLDLIMVILNNGNVIQSHLSYFSKLQSANQKQLDAWSLLSGGIGIEWKGIDEHLSLYGFVKAVVQKQVLRSLQNSPTAGSNVLPHVA